MLHLNCRRIGWLCGLWAVVVGGSLGFTQAGAAQNRPLRPKVELEEDVYTYQPADNGAGPLWCSGSTCLVRHGQDLLASGLETLTNCPPLNNCRWTLFRRETNGWQLVQTDPVGRTREPAPLAVFSDGRVFLSANPTLQTNRQAAGGPARPEILQFSSRQPERPPERLLPIWEAQPHFTEHSYRTLAADGPNRELVLFQNVDYTHAEWAFFDRSGQWSAHGKLVWPWGAEYDKPQPIRVCYPNVALRDHEVHFCGVSDIVEPYGRWREFKNQLTGREWDYDFRRLFYSWTPDIRTGRFNDWVEISSRDKTCGWISPGDLWVAPDHTVHIVWTERALDERLRTKFFPNEKQAHSLNYARLREGHVVLRRSLLEAREGEGNEIPSLARFQITPDQRLIVFYYVQGSDRNGHGLSENRMFEIGADGEVLGAPVTVPLHTPFTGGFAANVRAGSAPSDVFEFFGQQAGKSQIISYIRVRLF